MQVTLAQAGIVAGILTLSWIVGGPKEIFSAPPTGNHPHAVFNTTSKAHAEKVASLVPDSIVQDDSGHYYVRSKTSYDEARPYFTPWLRENDYFRTNQFLSEVKYEAESVVTDHENCGMGPSYCIECGEDACFDCDTYCDNCEQTIHKNCIEQHGDDCLEAESFSAQEGDKCPHCYCEHENVSLDSEPPYFDGEVAWVEIQCDDCNMKATAPTYDFEFDKQGILEEVGLPIAVNMENPNYGTLRCSRCHERIVRAAESFSAEEFDRSNISVPKDWEPKKYPYEKRVTSETKTKWCENCGELDDSDEDAWNHYQFVLKQKNSTKPVMRFISGGACEGCGSDLCQNCMDGATSGNFNPLFEPICDDCGYPFCKECKDEDRCDNCEEEHESNRCDCCGHVHHAESFSAQEAFKPESNFVAIKKLKKNWKGGPDATWEEMLRIEIGRLRDRLIMKGHDPDAKIGSPYYAESFSADVEMIECGGIGCDETFTIDEGLDIGGIDYCEECYDIEVDNRATQFHAEEPKCSVSNPCEVCDSCKQDIWYPELPGHRAESHKLNPVEKPIISGAASGATIEGLEDLMMSEPYDSEDCPLCLEKIDFIEAYEELPNDLCEGCSDAVQEKRYDHAYSAETLEDDDSQEELAKLRTKLSKQRTAMSAMRTALAGMGLYLAYDTYKDHKKK